MRTAKTFSHLYIGNFLKPGRVTLAISQDEAGLIKVGLAFCSPKDQFTRKKGREIASLRLAGEDEFYIEMERKEEWALKEQTTYVLSLLAVNKIDATVKRFNCLLPKWAKDGPVWSNWDLKNPLNALSDFSQELGGYDLNAYDGWEPSMD